jgi:hypothetical protein
MQPAGRHREVPGRIELARFHAPEAIRAEPGDAPANTLGIRRVMVAGLAEEPG